MAEGGESSFCLKALRFCHLRKIGSTVALNRIPRVHLRVSSSAHFKTCTWTNFSQAKVEEKQPLMKELRELGGVKLTTLAFSGFHCRKKTLQLATQEAGLQFATLDDFERHLAG